MHAATNGVECAEHRLPRGMIPAHRVKRYAGHATSSLGGDGLPALVRTTRRAHPVRHLGGSALGAGRRLRRLELPRGLALPRPGAGHLLLWDRHRVALSLIRYRATRARERTARLAPPRGPGSE